LTIALHYVFNTPEDRIVWDVGHQTYPHKILTGRRDDMHSLRQEGGISGFPRRAESEYDTFGTAHSSTSISAALAAAVGLAFQVVDDILDVTADSATLGKTAGKDAADNKPTYVSILGMEASVALAETLRQNAHTALDLFGARADRLRAMADLIVQRKT